MDIDQGSYKKNLLPVLQHIANASFVSFDLEMSGIHKNSRYGLKSSGHDNGKPNLQTLYEETRIAAETFQVLQVGITCVEEDREKGELSSLCSRTVSSDWRHHGTVALNAHIFLSRLLPCSAIQL